MPLSEHSDEYRVKIDIFDGPFDLLLYLIKVNEMDIYDISISEITNQYLDYITLMQEMNLDFAGDFLVMAATLIRLKAQQLLPAGSDTEAEDEIDEILSTRDLIEQLIEYRRMKEMAGELQDRHETFSKIYYRSKQLKIPDQDEEDDEDKEQLRMDLQTLFYAFTRVLPYVEASRVTHIIPEQFTVSEKIESIVDRLSYEKQVNFTDIVRTCTGREELIVTFLALMELCRRRTIKIMQQAIFGEIQIKLSESVAGSEEMGISDNDE